VDKYKLAEMNWPEVEEALRQGVDTVVVTFGSTEQHGLHLPLATDFMWGEELGERAALPDWPYRRCILQARIKEAQGDLDGEIDWDIYMQDMTEMGLTTSSSDRQEMPSYEATLSRQTSLADYLLWQLALAAEDEPTKEIGTYLIGNIDDAITC